MIYRTPYPTIPVAQNERADILNIRRAFALRPSPFLVLYQFVFSIYATAIGDSNIANIALGLDLMPAWKKIAITK